MRFNPIRLNHRFSVMQQFRESLNRFLKRPIEFETWKKYSNSFQVKKKYISASCIPLK